MNEANVSKTAHVPLKRDAYVFGMSSFVRNEKHLLLSKQELLLNMQSEMPGEQVLETLEN